MGLDGIGSVQTLFLISNSFHGFVFGVFLYAFGVGQGVLMGMVDIAALCSVLGLVVIFLAILGYWGAVKLNRRILHIYSLVTIGFTALEVAYLVHLKMAADSIRRMRVNGVQTQPHFELRTDFVICTCNVIITMVSVLLACTLPFQIRRHGGGTHEAGSQ